MEIGFRAHDFGKFQSTASLAEKISSFPGEHSIQLALTKVVPSCKEWQEWTNEYIEEILKPIFEKRISTAVVGCYINPVHPDEDIRKEHIERFKKSISLSNAFRCKIVATETGSLSPDCNYHPHTMDASVFDTLIKSVAELVDSAEKHGVTVALEPVSRVHTLCSLERARRILDKIDSPYLGIIYDPINLIPWLGLPEADGAVLDIPSTEAIHDFVTSAIDAFGDKIVAIHAKNYVLDRNGWKIGNKPLLEGVFDWETAIRIFHKRSINVPIILENLDPCTLEETIDYLFAIQ